METFFRTHAYLVEHTELHVRRALMDEIARLSPRERQIMELRFGLADGRELTQKEVADRIGISQSYISRLEKKIIKRIRENLASLC